MTESILKKLDDFLNKNDYASAEKHLLQCLNDAQNEKNHKIILLISNELMGLYRKLGKREKALEFTEKALNEISIMAIPENVGAATTYLNTATVYKAFGMPEESIKLFEKAKIIYEKNLPPHDSRLGGLYNNMALTLADLKRFEEAESLFRRALAVMENVPLSEPEQAVTYLNMASAQEAKSGIENASETIGEYLEKAMALLDESPDKTSGNYAFVCEKCAPVFAYYGYFYYENQLKERSKKIYEGS